MIKLSNKIRLLVSCLAISILLHISIVYALRMFVSYDFTAPVNLSQLVEVDMARQADSDSPSVTAEKLEQEKAVQIPAASVEQNHRTASAIQEQLQTEPKPASSVVKEKRIGSPAIRASEVAGDNSANKKHPTATADQNLSPLSSVGGFLSTKNEKLTYLISMYGLPVGNAELEAKHENEEILLTLRVKSNDAISTVFLVNNIVETRHVSGRFIMTKIIQQEGTFRSDLGVTINQGKKRVTWSDNIKGRSQTTKVASAEVIDTLSGLYLLRSRPLQVGITEMLHIFDSEYYADVPVEILRRETVRLPNLTNIDTLVIRPLQKTAGIFRRTGDILIWITDDVNKVPVKIVTSVALGTVTVELMSAESTLLGEKDMAK